MPNARAKSGWFPRPTAPAAAAVCRSSLPPLAVRPDIELVRPTIARLIVQRPIGFSYGVGLDQAVRRKIGHRAGRGAEQSVDGLAIDRTVDDQMGNMNILGCELARHGLYHRAQAELRCSKRGEARAAANAGSSASKQDRTAATRYHVTRRLAAGQKAAITGELPCLKNSLALVSISGDLTLAPALKRQTSIAPSSASTCANSAWMASSLRTSVPTARAVPPDATMSCTTLRDFSASRRATQTE